MRILQALLVVALVALPVPALACAAPAPDRRPCDIYASYGTPCAAAHSVTRALYADYDGPLYRVTRASDAASLEIGVTRPGGYADAAAQQRFCATTSCVITAIRDQSPNDNTLTVAGGGATVRTPNRPAVADRLPVTAGGRRVFGLWIDPGMGYRDTTTRGVPVGAAPESMYMVASGTHTNPRGPGPVSCCFDYGNVQPSVSDEGAGTMDAINFSAGCWFTGIACRGTGPWVQADLENGVYQSTTGAAVDPTYTGDTSPFVMAGLRNDGVESFALASGDATRGTLRTRYSGPLPYVSQLEAIWCLGVIPAAGPRRCDLGSPYRPMEKQGALVLGTGGDNSNLGEGSFFEGVLTVGIPPTRADDEVHADIVSVGYREGW